MSEAPQTARVLEITEPGKLPLDELLASGEPVIMRGLTAHWPLVQAGLQSRDQLMTLLRDNDAGRAINTYIGEPAMAARFGYNDTCTGFNYNTAKMTVTEVMAAITKELDQDEHRFYYINSLIYGDGFPNLLAENDLQIEAAHSFPRTSRIWIGTESRAAAHWDIPKNIACCVAGDRRFTLFPPEQVQNLYPGPLHLTPGGQAVTMADLKTPDFDRFPRLREALANAITADLKPGDALYYPSMWWHEVEALARFNVMVNYWWTDVSAAMGNPLDILMHAVLGLRDRPDDEKQAWRAMFDYYIFGSADLPRAHLPEGTHGALGELDDNMARQLRALIRQNLNR